MNELEKKLAIENRRLTAENKTLLGVIESLNQENSELKTSVYEYKNTIDIMKKEFSNA